MSQDSAPRQESISKLKLKSEVHLKTKSLTIRFKKEEKDLFYMSEKGQPWTKQCWGEGWNFH